MTLLTNTVDGKPFFITDQSYPVLTAGHGSEATLLRRTSASSGYCLRRGRLRTSTGGRFVWADSPVAEASGEREPHFIVKAQRVSGSGGGNGMMDSCELNGDRLTSGQMGGAMVACAQGMDTKKAYFEVLRQASTFKIAQQHHELFDAASQLVARFKARLSRARNRR